MSTELFNRAVAMIRQGRNFVDILTTLETEALPSTDVRSIISEARKYVQEVQKVAFDSAIECFKQGQSHFEVSKKFVECGFHPYDADVAAARAQKKAQEETAQ
jgi:hypothetical protein